MTLVKINTLGGWGDWVWQAQEQMQQVPGYNPWPVDFSKTHPNKTDGIDWGKLIQDYWYIPAIALMMIILLKKF